jgi:hypothetical protein
MKPYLYLSEKVAALLAATVPRASLVVNGGLGNSGRPTAGTRPSMRAGSGKNCKHAESCGFGARREIMTQHRCSVAEPWSLDTGGALAGVWGVGCTNGQ